MAKRDATSAELTVQEAKESKNTQTLFFVYATSDRCFSICTEKLLARAPASYFAALWTHRNQESSEGESQANPMRLPIPEWFVQGVADWTQPLASSELVFVGVPEAIVLDQLMAVGWSADKEGDLPFRAKFEAAPSDEAVQLMDSLFVSKLPPDLTNSMGKIQRETKFFAAAYVPSPATLELPPGESCDAVYRISKSTWKATLDACGLSAAGSPSRKIRYFMRENCSQSFHVVRARRIGDRIYNYIYITFVGVDCGERKKSSLPDLAEDATDAATPNKRK